MEQLFIVPASRRAGDGSHGVLVMVCAEHDPDGMIIAEFDTADEARDTANAELFVSAKRSPGLLAACESLIAEHDEYARACNFSACGCGTCEPLRAAILKAKSGAT